MKLRRIFYPYLLLSFLIGLLVTQTACEMNTPVARPASPPVNSSEQVNSADFAVVDPNYIYDQLFYMATHFLHREAGFDTNLPPDSNGHDEFAAYWTQEMRNNLQGFGAQVRNDPFPAGWAHRPGIVPGFNVEVTIPGATSPEQVVVIGCHYDAMANSTQSAYDDTSGCAIELGVAKAMATFWRSHHIYPARTLRFVLFDAEEQNLLGSFHYVNSTINGDLSNIVAMFNEEQNGVAYPVRYLGQLDNPLLPLYINVTPLHSNDLYSDIDTLPPAQRAKISHFRDLIQQAIPAVFQEFLGLKYLGLTYHDKQGHNISRPIFTPDQLSNIQEVDDTDGGSDEVAFTQAGIPSATMVSDASYYDNHPSPWAFPNDLPQDTIQLLNTYAMGGTHQSYALTLALALPAMITTWMLNQPDILGQVSLALLPAGPLAAISDIGYPQAGTMQQLDAAASFDPGSSQDQLTYRWDFGDGQQATGRVVTHTYMQTGQYTIKLTVSSPRGTRQVKKLVNIVEQPTTYPNQYSHPPRDTNSPNPAVALPTPNNSLQDNIIRSPIKG